MKQKIILFIILILLLINSKHSFAQSAFVQGTIYDYYSKKPIDAVSVITASGRFAVSDSMGRYSIRVENNDQFWFNYLGKNTQRYKVDTLSNFTAFDVALHVDARWLPNVTVKNKNYKQDSIQNRRDYAKVFNFRKPTVKTFSAPASAYVPGAVTAGLDLDEFINMFRFKRNRQLLSFQERLLQEEQDKYINYRFTKRLVKELVAIDSSDIKPFMDAYRPSYELLQTMNELELGYFIQQCYLDYITEKRRRRNPY